MKRLQISFSTLACPDWSWHDVVKHGPEYGYDGVELRLLNRETNLLIDPDLQTSRLPTRRRELHDAGFRVCGLASSIRFDDTRPEIRLEQLETGKKYLELAASLECEMIRVFGDLLPPEDQHAQRNAAFDWIAAGLAELGDLAQPYGIQILLETHGDFSASPPAAEAMRRANHPQVGLVWDTHHPWRFFNESLELTWSRLSPWTRHTHWKDSVLLPESYSQSEAGKAAAQAASALMAGHRHADYVLFLGGEFPARDCLRILIESGYTGWHSLEWEKMWHPELLDPEVALPLFPQKLRFLAETL